MTRGQNADYSFFGCACVGLVTVAGYQRRSTAWCSKAWKRCMLCSKLIRWICSRNCRYICMDIYTGLMDCLVVPLKHSLPWYVPNRVLVVVNLISSHEQQSGNGGRTSPRSVPTTHAVSPMNSVSVEGVLLAGFAFSAFSIVNAYGRYDAKVL